MNWLRNIVRPDTRESRREPPMPACGPRLNLDLLLAVKSKILETRRVDMTGWEKETNKDSLCIAQRLCGTVYCIGGWAIILSGGSIPDTTADTFYAARTLLGLSHAEAELLFFFHEPKTASVGPYGLLCAKVLIQRPRSPEYAAVVAEAIDLCVERNATTEQSRSGNASNRRSR